MNIELLNRQRSIVKSIMAESDTDGVLSYHNWRHVSFVVNTVFEIVEQSDLEETVKEDIALASIWHDADFAKGQAGHEERSADMAEKELHKEGLSEDRIKNIKRLILATQMDYIPQLEDERIIKDADLAHLASEDYLVFYNGLHAEINALGEKKFSSKEWRTECIKFMSKLNYQSDIGKQRLSKGKQRNLENLMNMEDEKLSMNESQLTKQQKKELKKERNKDKPKFNPEKGIETMFRVALRNHVSLSRIADNKANTLISVNAIILSIVLSALFPKLDSNPWLMLPGIGLILVSISTIIMATLSTIPKTTHGTVSKSDVKNKKGNLLFFGNFHQMSLAEYEWSVGELMKDGNYLYSSLTRDLYFLGKVLNKKYNLLRYAYFVFVIGLILSIFLFVFSIVTLQPDPTITTSI